MAECLLHLEIHSYILHKSDKHLALCSLVHFPLYCTCSLHGAATHPCILHHAPCTLLPFLIVACVMSHTTHPVHHATCTLHLAPFHPCSLHSTTAHPRTMLQAPFYLPFLQTAPWCRDPGPTLHTLSTL